jgi:glycogen(starch) synthase
MSQAERVPEPTADYLFEVSWEVCNQVGGINTVLKSKAAVTGRYYANYVLIGPYVERNATLELEEREPPEQFKAAFKGLKALGITCRYGAWQIKGEPATILIDFATLTAKKNDFKTRLWEWYKIDSLAAGWDFEEPILFAAAVAELLSAIEKQLAGKRLVAHFHEWMTGAAILFLKQKRSAIRTVFTTHATMLGRAICGTGGNLYDMLDTIDPMAEAYRYQVAAKHLTELACTRTCDIFTTVSEITAIEAKRLLGREPDILVLNGLDISKFPTFEETSIKHITCREKLRSFLTFYFFPYHVFPIEHNLILFMTGRQEFKNKGIDITIQALGRLNRMLQEPSADPQRTISIFFWIPMEHAGVKVELLENKNYYHHIKNYIEFNSEKILSKVLHDFLAQKDMTGETFFTKEFVQNMKKDLLQFRRRGNAPLCTNYLPDEENNEIIKALRAAGLNNSEQDKVKVIVHPLYLDGNDGLLNLSYYDAIAGTHLGLFPSYYEPWGYTPLETAAMGVSAITTDLAGFGRFIAPHLDEANPGIRVLKRYKKGNDEVVDSFAQMLFDISQLSHADRVQNKIAAKHLTALCDWEKFIAFYIEAHNRALQKA